MIYQKVWEQALTRWGRNPQINMVIEECSELIKAIMKYKREKTQETLESIIEEAADVQIMLFQLAYILGIEKEINAKFHEKVEKLKIRVKK